MEKWRKQRIARVKKILLEEPDLNMGQIAERVGVTHGQVSYTKQKMIRDNDMESWKKQQLERLRKVLIDEPDLNDTIIAERFGIPKSTVTHIRLRVEGFQRHSSTKRPPKKARTRKVI